MSKNEDKKTQKAPILKSMFGRPLGLRTADHFKGKTFNQKTMGYSPNTFRQTQHKG